MPELEKDIEAKVCSWARLRGVLPLKFTSPSMRGWPDRVFILPEGRYVWIEFKRQGRKPTTLQRKRLEKLQSMGCHAYWTDSSEKAILILEEFIDGLR